MREIGEVRREKRPAKSFFFSAKRRMEKPPEKVIVFQIFGVLRRRNLKPVGSCTLRKTVNDATQREAVRG